MKATIKISERDYVQAIQFYYKSIFYEIFRENSICFIILITSVPIFFLFNSFQSFLILISCLIGIFAVGLVFYFIVTPYSARSEFRTCKLYEETSELELKTDGIQLKSNNGESFIKWDHIYKLYQNQHYLYIHLSSNLALVIPKSIADSDFNMKTFVKTIESKTSFKEKSLKRNKNSKIGPTLFFILIFILAFILFSYFN